MPGLAGTTHRRRLSFARSKPSPAKRCGRAFSFQAPQQPFKCALLDASPLRRCDWRSCEQRINETGDRHPVVKRSVTSIVNREVVGSNPTRPTNLTVRGGSSEDRALCTVSACSLDDCRRMRRAGMWRHLPAQLDADCDLLRDNVASQAAQLKPPDGEDHGYFVHKRPHTAIKKSSSGGLPSNHRQHEQKDQEQHSDIESGDAATRVRW